MNDAASPQAHEHAHPSDAATDVVTFTKRGESALDQLVDDLTANCDGTAKSIAQILDHVLNTEITELADSLSESALGSAIVTTDSERTVDAATLDILAVETPDEAAHRRLGLAQRATAANSRTPGDGLHR